MLGILQKKLNTIEATPILKQTLFVLLVFATCALHSFAAQMVEPGYEFKDCDDCPIMVVIPEGQYGMGGPPIDQGRPFSEGELRLVNVPRFSVGKYEITVNQWRACVNDDGCQEIKLEDWVEGEHPVANISWTEATKYTKWLSQKTEKPYRLLTEAEWEYVARANGTRARFFGVKKEEICRFSNVYDETAEEVLGYGLESLPCSDGFEHSAPVGTLKPNQFGVHDMVGNVWEWVEDCQATHWRNAPNDSSARVSGICTERAYRGGSWLSHPPKYLQTHHRYKFLGSREIDLGFRIALSLDVP